ncbi:MAG: hypothetical protein JRJ38_08015 [Deltaproteobacteria bacterium]|nr:hypothetical protein [Deltaproteobacteria bacterium]
MKSADYADYTDNKQIEGFGIGEFRPSEIDGAFHGVKIEGLVSSGSEQEFVGMGDETIQWLLGRSLAEAGLDWPADKTRRIELKSESWGGLFYTSSVSKKVITAFSPFQFAIIGAGLVGLNCILFLTSRRWVYGSLGGQFV